MAYPEARLTLLSLQAPDTWEAPDLTELLRHELTHLALANAIGQDRAPRWFDEGLAIRESGEFPWKRRVTLGEAVLYRRLMPLSELENGFPSDHSAVSIAYAESADFVRFLMRDPDRARFGSLIERVRAGSPFDRALGMRTAATCANSVRVARRSGPSFRPPAGRTGGGLLWALVVALAAVAWVRRRSLAKAKLSQWAREEAEAEARAAAAANARAQPAPLEASGDAIARDGIPRNIKVVEHEGRYLTPSLDARSHPALRNSFSLSVDAGRAHLLYDCGTARYDSDVDHAAVQNLLTARAGNRHLRALDRPPVGTGLRERLFVDEHVDQTGIGRHAAQRERAGPQYLGR